jgi:uncharacterized membrane protein
MPDDRRELGGVSVLEHRDEDPADGAHHWHSGSIWALILLGGGILWLRPITSSLWLDELVTWWVVKDSLGDALHRAYAYQGQSIIYYPMEWLVRHAGHAEWFLRLPSLLAMGLAAYLLYRLSLRLADRETARLSVLVFAVWPDVVFEASNARPYALATLLTVAATWALVRWLDRGRAASMLLYVVLAASVAYAHVLFALVLPCHLLYALARQREDDPRVRRPRIALAFVGIAVLDLGLVVQLAALASRRGALTLPSILSVTWLASLLVPAAVVVAIVLGSVLAWRAGHHVSIRPAKIERSTAILVLSGMLIPVLTLAAFAIFTPLHLVETRYTMASAPFAAVFCAGVIRSLQPRQVRWFVCICLAILAIVGLTTPSKRLDEWRWAAVRSNELADADTVVLIRAGLIESSDVSWFDDRERESYLMSPMSYYWFEGAISPLPYDLSQQTKAFVNSELAGVPASVDKIVVVSGATGINLESYIEGRLEATGWVLTDESGLGQMLVVGWTRSAT